MPSRDDQDDRFRFDSRSYDAQLAVLLERMGDQDRALARIESHVRVTNSRVSKLELAQAIAEDRVKQNRAHIERADAKSSKRLAVFAAVGGTMSGVLAYLFLAATHIV